MNESASDATGPVDKPRGNLPRVLTAVLSVLPNAPLAIIASSIMQRILDRNPGLIARLGPHAHKRFAVDPLDCPFVFLIEPLPMRPRLQVLETLTGIEHDARIAGTVIVLAGLLEGIYDGDALFFSRDLTIEGDTAAVLALRNAIEDSDLDPGRTAGLPDALAPAASQVLHSLGARIRVLLDAPISTDAAGSDLP